MPFEETTALSTPTVNHTNGQAPHTTQPAAPTLADIHSTLTNPVVMQSLMGFEANDRGNALAVHSVFGEHFLHCEARALPRSLASKPIKEDRKSTRLNSSHSQISYAVFCLKKKTNESHFRHTRSHRLQDYHPEALVARSCHE